MRIRILREPFGNTALARRRLGIQLGREVSDPQTDEWGFLTMFVEGANQGTIAFINHLPGWRVEDIAARTAVVTPEPDFPFGHV
ncbi:hypothetical protein A3I95_01315 [Candidatus Nomurabacteria bacterium RIFCSPLOWO2_02_FULL_44_12]|uniref:Uncharacterized protein n=1 Tax=Candidatus Nomurabacteria bacterium RIFCSPLOWO2_12_FULL_44_11 TaxID=1801796 RepID=A0A1F6Y6X3_9BACT|nr:MAG: hypothetical protein A3E95_01485 [Candidatus Nomurabacteria bacterium RIFCSPHIGHO2_12_FULL_44_22b]OGJ02131.1 MAG: hypothetical protein A3G53_00460 [Candidatus Nomurabacteria bacterium RIFCSPLOWO2_12_FULL_44_11]OGJ08676.1 MAG: hypothetical protein A3I95_01315 [Candidatus Nomurabacteria bacterium RIFCSPLOWO2_02_FULL_44_12]